jgi:predicted small metal-binding protein
MAEYRVECACGAVLTDDTEAGLVTKIKTHVKEVHNDEWTDKQAQELIKEQNTQ